MPETADARQGISFPQETHRSLHSAEFSLRKRRKRPLVQRSETLDSRPPTHLPSSRLPNRNLLHLRIYLQKPCYG
jgi:hypothetical protein